MGLHRRASLCLNQAEARQAFNRPSIMLASAWFLPTAATPSRQIGHLPRQAILSLCWEQCCSPHMVWDCLGIRSPGRLSHPPRQELQKPASICQLPTTRKLPDTAAGHGGAAVHAWLNLQPAQRTEFNATAWVGNLGGRTRGAVHDLPDNQRTSMPSGNLDGSSP